MGRIDARAAVLAGIIAALVFMMLEMVLVASVGGESPWGPPRMIAAIGMGQTVLPPPATFDLTVFWWLYSSIWFCRSCLPSCSQQSPRG